MDSSISNLLLVSEADGFQSEGGFQEARSVSGDETEHSLTLS